MPRSTRRTVRTRIAVGALVALVALTLPLAACGGDSGAASGPVAVKLTDYAVDPSRTTAKAGAVTFDITNDATDMTHEFLVVRTDLDPRSLPTDEDGAVDEKGPGLTFVDEKEDIGPGEQATLTVDLQPGTYVLLCNLDDHYARGMVRSFTVES